MSIKKYNRKIFLAVIALSGITISNAQTMELSLQQALQQAAKGNRTILISRLRFQQSEEASKEATSFRLPDVSLQASYSVYPERPVIYLRNESATPKLDDVRFGGRYAFLTNLQASYPLIAPPVKSNIKLAINDNELKKEAIRNTGAEIALEISKLYLRILLSQEQKKVITQSLQRNELALNDSRQLFLQGKNLKSDTLSNFIAVQNLRSSVSGLNNDMLVLFQQLKQLLGLSATTELLLTDSLQTSWNASQLASEEDLLQAVADRSDIKIQSLQLSRSKDLLTHTRAAFKPRLHAVASYQLQAQSDHPQAWNYQYPRSSFAGLALDIPIYSGNRLAHRTRQSSLNIEQRQLELEELQSAALTEIITLKSHFQKAWDQWLIQQQNTDAAQVSYDMSFNRYRHGLGTRLELSDAELALTRSRLDLLQSIFQLQLTDWQMKKATGKLTLEQVEQVK